MLRVSAAKEWRGYEVEQTQFGFSWGPATVVRLCDNPKFGAVIAIEGRKGQSVEVRVTPGGYVKVDRINRKAAG